VWMLPMTANEFGHVFADRHDAMQRLADEIVGSSEQRVSHLEVRSWIADAFATAVMGPAYVWSAMLLRADPSTTLDCRRVAVMTEMLDLLGGPQDDPDSDHGPMRAEARRAWAAAVADAARAEVPAGPGASEAGDPSELTELTTKVVKEVHDRVLSPLTARDWTQALSLADELRGIDDDAGAGALGSRLRSHELRHLLLGGWMERMRLARNGDGHDGLEGLGRRLGLACMALIDQGESGGHESTKTVPANMLLETGDKPSATRGGGPAGGTW